MDATVSPTYDFVPDRTRDSRKCRMPYIVGEFTHERLAISNGLMFSVRGKFKNVLQFVPPFSTSTGQLD